MATITKCAVCDNPTDSEGLTKCEECGDLICSACVVQVEEEGKSEPVNLCEDCEISVYESEEGEEEEDEESEDDEDDDDEDDEDDLNDNEEEELEIEAEDDDK